MEKCVDSNVHTSSSSCTVNFAQTNPQPSGTSSDITSQPNTSTQSMNHFYSRTTIDGSTPAYGMPQQTMASTFGQGYMHLASSFCMQTLVWPYTLSGVTAEDTQTLTTTTKYQVV
jgi:hypothetical protein